MERHASDPDMHRVRASRPKTKYLSLFGSGLSRLCYWVIMSQRKRRTDEQESEIEKLHLDFQKKSLSVRNKIREKNAQLNTLISEGADMNKVNQLVEEIGDLRTEVQKGMISTHMKVRNLLSDDQKVKYDNHFISRYGTPDHSGGFGRHGRGWN
jgi:Spy/CpxP family protein refolding chaperone